MKENKKITKSARATKVNISINDELLERADSFCEKNYLSRSGLISLSLSQYLIAQEVNNLLRNMTISMQKIADNGTVDEETMEQLKEMQIICNALSGKQ